VRRRSKEEQKIQKTGFIVNHVYGMHYAKSENKVLHTKSRGLTIHNNYMAGE
jgi:hypothetical protein